MSKQDIKQGTLLAPLPVVFVSCGDMENSNVLTVAWTGIVNSDPSMCYISVRKQRYSHKMIESTKEFAINMPSSSLTRRLDKAGVISGKNVNKFEELHLHKEDLKFVKCPGIAECPIILECKVREITNLGSHDMFLADIINVKVDEELITKSGKIDFTKADLVAYSHGEYFKLGNKLGKFGYSVKKRK
ncbi:MAG: flavin reductase family protein [Clostridia bacterium]|nr:flavin reductase family protein [Clostridia bacterium]